MARQIKFKAWNKDKKIMLLEKGDLVFNPYLTDIHGTKHIGKGIELINDKYIWLEFTGLKDKNGKDIYEGDIVDSYFSRYLVSFGWGDDSENYGESYGVLFGERIVCDQEQEECEIIGNIYENPELLESKNG